MSPTFTKKILYPIYKSIFQSTVSKVNRKVSSKIPQHELQEKHVANAKLLATREHLLVYMPKNGVVAELGVNEGDFSEKILQINNPRKLHLVDVWGSKRYGQDKRKYVEDRFADQVKAGLVQIDLGYSTTVVEQYEENYFDWIYIDTDHTYKTTIAELESYRTKLKKGGIIAGHDFVIGNWNGVVRYGVIEAVHQFCIKYDWEILYLTAELHTSASFAIRKR